MQKNAKNTINKSNIISELGYTKIAIFCYFCIAVTLNTIFA